MWPPHSVKRWATPAALSVRATRCPPGRSIASAALEPGHVRHFQLEPVGILEEHRVVARPVLREFLRRAVEWGDAARREELVAEAVDVGAGTDPERDVIDPDALPVEAVAGVIRLGLDEPEVARAVGEAGHARLLVNRPVAEVAQEIAVERE